jgi:membrane-associated phospholipid phosphatase
MLGPGLIKAGIFTALAIAPLGAQGPVLGMKEPTNVSGWDGAAAAGGVALVFLLDRPARSFFQAYRSKTLNQIADVMRPMGEPAVLGGVAGGIFIAGIVGNDEDLLRAGGRVLFTGAVTLAAVQFTKLISGRVRPDSSKSPFSFRPFRNRQSGFVSGHAGFAFSLATVLSDELNSTLADVVLYTMAGGTAWSRLNDNRHWPSDVVGGALLGYSIGKMAGGRWEVFGVTTPRFLEND